VDIDPSALEVAQENCEGFEELYVDLVQSSVADLERLRLRADTVVMNPPFGTRREVRACVAAPRCSLAVSPRCRPR
jgi:predicted RNA methylase